DDDGAAGLKDRADGVQNLQRQFGEFGTAVVDHRTVHGPQDPFRNVGWTRDLEKVAAAVNHHWSSEMTYPARRCGPPIADASARSPVASECPLADPFYNSC